MQVVIGSDGWSGSRFRSAFTYSNGVLLAARAAGCEAQPYQLPPYYGARLGGLVRPWARARLGRYDVAPGTLVHQTTHGAWRGAHVATVLDTYAFRQRGGLPGTFRRSAVRTSVRRAQRIVTLSESGARELARTFPREREKARWAYVAFETPAPGRRAPAHDALWVGATGPRKDPDAYLALAQLFPRRSFAMRVHGEGAGTAAPPNVVRLPPQDDLDATYRSVPVLVVTSTFEGFHMPAMEAYLRGANLVLPRIEPFAEIYGADEAKVFWFDRAAGVPAIAEAFARARDAPLAAPRPEIVRSVSYATVGQRLRAIYEEVTRR